MKDTKTYLSEPAEKWLARREDARNRFGDSYLPISNEEIYLLAARREIRRLRDAQADSITQESMIRLVHEVADELFSEIEKRTYYSGGSEFLPDGFREKALGIAALRDALTAKLEGGEG